jgi:hypothetical protein
VRNFFRLAEGIDTVSIVHALHSRPKLWNRNSLRRDTAELAECDDIWLRFPTEAACVEQGLGAFECVNYPAMAELPAVRSIIFGLMRQIEGERLGPVIITRLAPGKRVHPHDDGEVHTSYYKRYFLTLHAKPGCIFRAGEEVIEPKVGELYWFDNSVEHEVVNNSADDRLALIVDIRPCT